MTIQTIGVGSAYNDKTGDKIRDAFTKVNDNFSDSENAASRLVQSSPTDTTAGRLMAVGAFGLGVYTNVGAVTNLDSVKVGQFFSATSTALNNPSGGAEAVLGWVHGYSSTRGVMTVIGVVTGSVYVRTNVNTWGAWQPVYSGANYQPETSLGIGVVRLMLNNSGGTISNTGTIAGASLLNVRFNADLTSWSGGIAPTGTWKQVFGVSLAAGETGYFVRIA